MNHKIGAVSKKVIKKYINTLPQILKLMISLRTARRKVSNELVPTDQGEMRACIERETERFVLETVKNTLTVKNTQTTHFDISPVKDFIN